jgi:hypothetical protein
MRDLHSTYTHESANKKQCFACICAHAHTFAWVPTYVRNMIQKRVSHFRNMQYAPHHVGKQEQACIWLHAMPWCWLCKAYGPAYVTCLSSGMAHYFWGVIKPTLSVWHAHGQTLTLLCSNIKISHISAQRPRPFTCTHRYEMFSKPVNTFSSSVVSWLLFKSLSKHSHN